MSSPIEGSFSACYSEDFISNIDFQSNDHKISMKWDEHENCFQENQALNLVLFFLLEILYKSETFVLSKF